jgi:hypothetical protein
LPLSQSKVFAGPPLPAPQLCLQQLVESGEKMNTSRIQRKPWVAARPQAAERLNNKK